MHLVTTMAFPEWLCKAPWEKNAESLMVIWSVVSSLAPCVCVCILSCVGVYTVCAHWELMQLQFPFAFPRCLKCWRTYSPKLTQAIILLSCVCVCGCVKHATHTNSRLNVLWLRVLCCRQRLDTHMRVRARRHADTHGLRIGYIAVPRLRRPVTVKGFS